MLASLEITFLNNRSLSLVRNGEEIQLAGLDNPVHSNSADMGKALRRVPKEAFKILIVHSPEKAVEAAAEKVQLYLCGHTHGGQIYLPLIGPLLHNSNSPRRLCAGLWKQGAMQGYTTFGVGGSIIPLRLGCRPEIALITLRRSST